MGLYVGSSKISASSAVIDTVALSEITNAAVEATDNANAAAAAANAIPTYVPSVSSDGVISWTNDKGAENPASVNIKGEKGDPGTGVITDTSGECTLVHTDNALPGEGLIELKVYGKSEQASTTGINLWDIEHPTDLVDGESITRNSDGTYQAVTPTKNRRIKYLIPVEAGATYYIKVKSPVTTGGGTASVYDGETVDSTELLSNASICEGSSFKTFVPTGDVVLVNYCIMGGSVVSGGITIVEPMICKSATLVDWEPYTGGAPSPSPDYPQEIESIGELSVASYGANCMSPTSEAAKTSNGITVTPGADGSYKVSGTATSIANFDFNVEPFFIGPDLQYAIFNTYKYNSIACGFRCTDGTSIDPVISTVNRVYDISGFAGKTINKVNIYIAELNTELNFTVKPMLCHPSDVSEFAPYNHASSTTPDLLTAEDGTVYELRSLPDGTRDELHVDGKGNVTLVQRVGSLVLDGSTKVSQIQQDTLGNYRARFYIEDIYVPTSPYYNGALCDKFTRRVGDGDERVDTFIFLTDARYRGVFLYNSEFSTAEKTQAWLAENGPITLTYRLATEELIDLGPAPDIELPEQISNVWPVSTPSTTLSAKWFTEQGEQVVRAMKLPEPTLCSKQSDADRKVYGVAFTGGSNSGTRLYDAVGMVAGVGTDTTTATNDFDAAEIYKDIKPVNRVFDVPGYPRITARYGDDNFAWDGSNGEVQVEIPLFWYNLWTDEEGRECWAVSNKPKVGYMPSPAHVREDGTVRDKCYMSAKKASIDANGVMHSISGVLPADSKSLATNLTAARKLDANCCTTTKAERMTRAILAVVEFATRDVQTVMYDFGTGIYSSTYTIQADATSTNTVSVTSAACSAFVVGQTVRICEGWITSDKVKDRFITAIDTTNNTITLSGDPFNVTTGWVIYNMDWKCGTTDSVLTPSGSPVSNTSGKYPCRYRYIEEPWGGGSEMITGLRTKRSGTSGAYTYELYEFEKLADDKGADSVDGMNATGIMLPTGDGYQKIMERTRFIPQTVGGSSTTYLSDYYYYPRYEVCVCRLGHYWNDGRGLGAFSLCCGGPASGANRLRLARLSTPGF